MACRAAGVRPPLGAVPPWLAKTFAPLAIGAMKAMGREPLFTRASIDALEPTPRPVGSAAEKIGHAPRSLEETLTDTYAFFRERGLIEARSR